MVARKKVVPVVESMQMSSSDDDGGELGNCQASDVQSWWEIPCIAHFCTLFRLYFDLLDFDIEDLEEALLTDGVEDSASSLLQDLIVRLLKGCFSASKDEITSSNYQMYLRRLFRIKCEKDPTKINPFDGDVAFHSLPLRTKVEILRDLCDFRLACDDVPAALKSLEGENLRLKPLGQDSAGSTYWYFYGTRLYREEYSQPLTSVPVRKRGRRSKQDKRQGPTVLKKWQVTCFTEQDWQILAQKFKTCKTGDERNLHQTLLDDYLPELPRLYAEREKVQRKRMLEQQVRRNGRSSSFHVEECNGDAHPGTSSSVNGCASGSVNGIGAGSSGASGALNGISCTFRPINRIRRTSSASSSSAREPLVLASISEILDKSNIEGIGAVANHCSGRGGKKVSKKAAQADSDASSCQPSTSRKALRGGYDGNRSRRAHNDDDNNNKINNAMDDEHPTAECSTTKRTPEEELRRKREEQERADRLLAEAIEREERKARLHLRERRGGAYSSPSNAGSRNSSSVSTERTQSVKAATVSKQTVAAAVSKKSCKASPVKASPEKKSGGKKGGKKGQGTSGGRMTNNSLSVSLSPLVNHEDETSDQNNDEDEDDSDKEEKRKKKKKKRKRHTDEEDDDSDREDDDDESGDEDDEPVVPKKKTKSSKGSGSPKKATSKKKKKKHGRSRSPSPSSSHTPGGKKGKKDPKASPSSSKKKAGTSKPNDDDDEQSEEKEEESQMEVDEDDDEDDFVEEEEEADYESIVARTLHNNNNNKTKGKSTKEKGKSKEKVKSKKEKRSAGGSEDEEGGKKAGKDKAKDSAGGSGKKKKPDKSGKSGKNKDKDGSKKSKSSKSESSSSGFTGASVNVAGGTGTSKTKVKSSVLFSQSEEEVQTGMHKVIESIKNHRDAWPFINPVDEDYAPNYYKIIDQPMDLQTMEDKLDNQEYASLDEFKADFGRIVDNCRKYNGPTNEYTEMVETVEIAFNKLLQRYIVPDESDEEISIEYTNAVNSERKRPSSKSSKKKEKETSSKSNSGTSSLPVSKEHKKENEPATKTPSKKSSSSKQSSSTSPAKGDGKDKEKIERKKKKQQLMRHHSRDSQAIENLSSVTAETLKDINKWLGDTPKPPEEYGGTASAEDSAAKAKLSPEAMDTTKLKTSKGATTPSGNSTPSPVIKEKKKKPLITPGGSSPITPKLGQKRKLEFSSNKKARSTQFIMDEDDEYNIDRDLSPPPPKITKQKEDGTKGKVKGSKKNKLGLNKAEKKEGEEGAKEKVKKDKHHHHHHKHHHHKHHHHHHKRDSSSAEKDPTSKPPVGAGIKSKAGNSANLKKSASMSSSSSVSSMSTNSSSLLHLNKGKGKKSSSKTATDDSSSSTTITKKSKKPKTGLGSTGNLLNTLKNSAAYKRMNQISRATKAVLNTSEPSKLKSDSLTGLGQPPAVGAAALESASAASAAAASAEAAEKKKCLLIADLPEDKEGGPKLSLGSVLPTDAIKLVNLKEPEELSDDDEFAKVKMEEGKGDKEAGDMVKKEIEEEEEKEDEEINRKLEPSKGFNREKCMPNLSAWIKAFGGPAKGGHPGGPAPGTVITNAAAVATVSPLISPVKKPDPDSKNKFRVMGRGVGEPEGKPHAVPLSTKPVHPIPHHPSVIKTSVSIPSPTVPVVRHHPAITDPLAPSWSPVTPLPGASPSIPSNPMLNPIKQAALAAAERGSTGVGSAIGEDLSSSPRHHTSKKHRNRKMSSSSLSSQSESGSPLVTHGQEGIGSGSGSYITSGSGGVVVNPPRWVDDHPWGPVSQSQSPSASSHVSSQSPAGPNSPFSPSINSPPPSTPQTPPRPPAPVRVGFYQDITASQHSSPEKVNESQSSPATPPTPNSVHGSAGSGGSGGSSSNANNSSSRRGGTSSGGNRDSNYSSTPLYAPRYMASSPNPNISGPASNASSGGLPSPSTPASNTSGGIAESPGNPNSPHSPKVVNMSSTTSGSNSGGSREAADYRSHSSSSAVVTTSSPSPVTVNGPQTPAHQQSSRSAASSVLHSSSPYGTPAHHYSSIEPHLRSSAAAHQLPDPAHSHHLHSPSSAHHHQTPAHAHSNAPQTNHPAHAHSMGHLGQPQQAHAGSSVSNQYHDSPSRYPPNLPHAHQQSSVASTSSTSSSSYSGSVSGGGSSNHQNLAQAHAHSRQPTSQTHLSHPYPSNPYTSNPRSINVAPNVYNNPISTDPSMNRYYKAALAVASGGGSELSLTMAPAGSGGSSSVTSSGATNTSSSSNKRSSRSNASANATPSPHPSDIPRSASVNPTAAAAVAAALEGKLGPGDLANGFWPHNLASLTQIVNSIPGAYRHYADAESMSKYQRAAAAAAAAQQESNSYPVTTNSSSSAAVGVITSGSKVSGGQSGGSHHHHHSSEKGSSGGSSASESAHHHHHLHHHHETGSSSTSSGSSGKKSSKSSSSSESKSSRSQSSSGGKSSSTSGGGIVPGSAFNFSSLTPDSLALYSKEMSDAATSSLYSASPPTLTPPLAHRASEFYPTASSASHFSHHSSFSSARSSAGGVPTPPITPYPFIPGSHPSPYQAHQSAQPFAAHSQSARGLDPYQQLFQGSPHVMGLLSHPSGYPAPYAHPHSSLGFNRPGGWI